MKKRLISSTIILVIALQLLSFPAVSFSNESDYPQVFQNAMCNDKNFIALIDDATENDDYINDSAVSIEANSSDVKSNGTKETLSNAVIMHDEELYVPVKAMSDILDYEVNLNSKSGEAYIQCEDESIIISTNPDDSDEEYLQGVLIDGITYAPVSDVASISGYQITLSEDGNKARLTDKFITRRLFIKIKNTDAFTDSAFAEIFLNTAKLAINSDRLIFAVYNTADEAERAYEILKGHPYVEYVESDGLLQVGFNSSYSWGTEYCNADYFSLNNPTIQNSEEIITVAIIDSGLNAQDPVFEGRVIYDSSATTVKDTHGHGTHVAGIVASFTQSAAENVKICPYKLEVDDDGSISYTSVANMYSVIQKASAHDIINMSLSISPLSEYQTLQTAITNSRNSLFVVAAGNDSTAVNSDSLANFVQSKANGIGVTAIGKSGEPASFTNHAISPSDHYIAAPGLNIRSTYYLHGYDYMNMSGTSQAAPHVAGACALLFLSTEKQDTPTEIKNTLFDSYCVAPEGWNTYYGRGHLHFDYKTSGEYENFEWSFEDRTLTITGSGMLPEVTDTSSLPWIFHKNFIDKVCFNGDIDGISRESIGNLPSVESLEVSEDNTHFKSVSGVLFSKDTSTLLYCPGIESGSEFIIPDGTVSISAGAFSSCKNLISVVIPTSVTTIEENAFSDCVDLAHIYYIGNEAQWNAMQRLDGWDKNAGTEAYENKYSLLCSYNAPDIVGVCGDTAVWKFWYIGGVLRIEGKGEIYDYDYVYDEENPGVIIGNTAGWSEYKDNILNFEIDNGITIIGARAFNSCGKFTDVVLPDTVTTIKEQAFDKTLKTLTLSKNFSHFDVSAFTYSSGLEKIYVHQENTAFSSKDGILYNKDGSELYFYPNGIMNESFTIPDGVRIIKDDAFSKNYVLKYISFNDCLEEIGDRAFKGTTMYALTALPSSLRRIGYRAFENCDNITIVSLPEGLEAIGERAFFSCDRLKEVHLPSSIKEIGGFAFSSSNYINKITFNGTQELWNTIQFADDWNNGIEDVTLTFNTTPTVSGSFGNNFTWTLDYSTGKLSINGKGAMDGYENYREPWHDYIDSITSVELSEGITSIKGYTFYNHQRIKSVSLPQSLEIIDDYTFYNCSALESIIIPDNVKSIDDYAFYKCTNLSTVVFPESLETIGSAAFNYSAVEKAALPNGVTSIGAYAFNNCSDLTEIHFSEALQTIGNYAFSGCSKVTEITLPSTLTTIGNYAFSGCSISEIVIPDKVIGIPEYAFANCKNLTSVTVPKSVKTIGNRAFYSDYYLSDIYYKGPSSGWNAISKHSSWSEYAGIYTSNRKPTIHYGEENHYSGTFGDNLTWVYWIDRKVLEISGNGAMPTWSTAEDVPWVGYISYISSVNISDGITGIGDYAFYNATALCEIVIPESVLSIGSNAFYGCTVLTKITIPDNVTSIGSSAFYGCTMLDSIALSKKLTVIGDNAFYGCSVLNDISLPDTLSDIGQGAFHGCLSLEEITIPQKVDTLKAYTFYNCSKLVKLNFSGNITEIGNYAFYNCTVLESITFPNSLTSIGLYAFYSCSGLKDITLPDNITFIGASAFSNCTALETVVFPAKLTSVSDSLFYRCTSLKSVTTPTACTSIGNYAFYNCSSLETATISEGCMTIGESAFYSCTKLSSLTLPSSLTNLKIRAFGFCIELTDIYYSDTREKWDSITKETGWDLSGKYTIHCTDDEEEEEEEILYSGNCGDSLTWEFFTETGVLKITGTGSMTSWTAASEVPWYHLIDNIVKVEIAEGVSTISDYSFLNYSKITSIELPKSLTRIGYAFANCYYLADVYYAGSESKWNALSKASTWASSAGLRTPLKKYTLHYAEEDVYSGTFGDNLTWTYYATQKHLVISGTGAIPNYTRSSSKPWYKYAANITKITIESGITSIGSYAFSELAKLTTVILPPSCTSIGDFAFNNCTLLADITIPEGCTYIGNSAFYYCRSIKSISIPKTCKIISGYAFYYCTVLESVTIPKGCTTIGNYAFYCTSLKSVVIPEGCTTIESNAFYSCWSLSSVYLPKSLTTIQSKAFGDCPSLSNIYYSSTQAKWKSVYKATNWDYLDSSWGSGRNYTIHYDYNNAVSIDNDKISVTLIPGQDSKLIVVCLNESGVAGIKLINVSESSEIYFDTAQFDFEFTSDSIIKAYLWANDNSLSPLCGAKSIKLP